MEGRPRLCGMSGTADQRETQLGGGLLSASTRNVRSCIAGLELLRHGRTDQIKVGGGLRNHWPDSRDLDCGKGIWERPPLGVRYPKVSTEERPSMRVFSEEIQSLLITVWNYQDIGGWLNIVGRRFKKAVPTWAE